MNYKPMFEKLADRIVAAANIGQSCQGIIILGDESVSPALVATNSQPIVAALTDDPLKEQVALAEQSEVVPPTYTVDPDQNRVLDENDVSRILFVISQDGLGPYEPLFDFSVGERNVVSGADLMQSLHARRWHACDVNQDLVLSPIDVLIVINEINRRKK